MIFPVVSGSSGIEIDGIRVAVGTPSCPELVPQLYCKFDDYYCIYTGKFLHCFIFTNFTNFAQSQN